MKSSDRTKTLPYVTDAGNTVKIAKPGALHRVAGDNNDLIHDSRKRSDKPFDEGLSLVGEKVFFLTICTPCFATSKYDRRLHQGTPEIITGLQNISKSTIRELTVIPVGAMHSTSLFTDASSHFWNLPGFAATDRSTAPGTRTFIAYLSNYYSIFSDGN
jgi:hypothetical protein